MPITPRPKRPVDPMDTAQKCDLKIKDDEQYRHEVVADIKPPAIVLEGLESALVRRKLGRILSMAHAQAAQDGAQSQQHSGQQRGDREENQYWKVVFKHVQPLGAKKGGQFPIRPRLLRQFYERIGADGEIRTPTPCGASPSS